MPKVAINGLGRIGRAVFKLILEQPALDLIAINDLVPLENLAYLLKYDTVYGRYEKSVIAEGDRLRVNGQDYRVFNETDPAQLPWQDLEIDLVFECTGHFTRREQLAKHLQAGAKQVLLSAPAKGNEIATLVYGVNDLNSEAALISCASCTTQCITPVVEIMGRRLGVKKATMTTVHAYTATQALVDGPAKKFARGRAAAANLVPTSTGAAIATTAVLPQYDQKFDAAAIRVPVAAGSIADVVFVTERPTSIEEVNQIFQEEAQSDRYQGVLAVTTEPMVSADILKTSEAAIVDLNMTQVVDGDLVKVMSWYDNEWGYASQMVKTALQRIKIPVVA